MAREGLRGDLTIALHRAVSLGILTRVRGLRVKNDGDFTTVNLTVFPVPTDPEGAIPHGLFLIILEEELVTDAKQSIEAAMDTAEGAAALSTDLDAYMLPATSLGPYRRRQWPRLNY
jgi:two-component system CheB/CheR fusion protein